MSPKKDKEVNSEEALTKVEKKVLIGEGTFVSLTLVFAIIGGVAYTVNLDGRVNAQASVTTKIHDDVSSFKNEYLTQIKVLNDNLSQLNTRLSRIEGKLGVKEEK